MKVKFVDEEREMLLDFPAVPREDEWVVIAGEDEVRTYTVVEVQWDFKDGNAMPVVILSLERVEKMKNPKLLVKRWLEENGWDEKKLEEALFFPGFCATCGPGTVAKEGDALVRQYLDRSFSVLHFHSPDRLVCTEDEDHEIVLWEELFEDVSPKAIIEELRGLGDDAQGC